MGFEFWLNGVKYEYKDLKTVSLSVDKHDLERGDMFEHTVIKIETRKNVQMTVSAVAGPDVRITGVSGYCPEHNLAFTNHLFCDGCMSVVSNREKPLMVCKGCGKPLLLENIYVDDGCPCNTRRGINFQPQHCSICGTEECVKPAHHLSEIFPTSQPKDDQIPQYCQNIITFFNPDETYIARYGLVFCEKCKGWHPYRIIHISMESSESSGVENGETGASGEPATPAEEFSGVLKHSPSNAPEDTKPCPVCGKQMPNIEGRCLACAIKDREEAYKNLQDADKRYENLQEGLVNELRRCRELLKEYEKIGTSGVWGKKIIEGTIFAGEEALKSGDAVNMLKAYKALKDCK